MENTYCERGHLMRGTSCGQCARLNKAGLVSRRTRPAVVTGSNRTLIELRALKGLLAQALITEAEYDERRNALLATF